MPKSNDSQEMVRAVTAYVARRLVERERALDEDPDFIGRIGRRGAARERRRRRRRAFGALVFGFFLGIVALVLIVLLLAGRS